MTHRFSRRIPDDLSPSPWALAIERARARGGLVDLTIANPQDAGLVDEALGGEPIPLDAATRYGPDPRGIRPAREAIAAEYASRGIAVDPDRILVTASTSESWSFLFKTLCDPGDAVLVPRPGYPLLETLAPLDGVVPLPYALDPGLSWGLRPHALDEALALARETDPGAAARLSIIAHVSPSNPTGRLLRAAERRRLEALAGSRGAAIVVDEVFARYPLAPTPPDALPSAVVDPETLTFVLDGVSKSCGLPGVKIGWILASGPGADEAMSRLEYVADAYLSASAPAQAALPRILDAGCRIRAVLQRRTAENLAVLRRFAAAPDSGWTLEEPEAGWMAVLCRTAHFQGADPAEALLARGVAVHPGWLFDLPEDRIVAGLLAPGLEEALARFR